MHKIIAIGWGEIGREGVPNETLVLDQESVRLTGKKHPNVLFIPTASRDAPGYIEGIRKYFGEQFGCEVRSLCLYTADKTHEIIAEKIAWADIVYVGGGNTLRMMKQWRRFRVDVLLRQAWENGTVMTGLSAGSICWFRQGHSDSRKFKDPSKKFDFIKVTGLGLADMLHCPHYDTEAYRRPELHNMMMKTPGIAIAIDNCAAIEIVDDTYRILSSKPSAQVYKVYRKNGKIIEEVIEQSENFRPMKELLINY